jgi:uncharacterized protein (TIGR03437 family)
MFMVFRWLRPTLAVFAVIAPSLATGLGASGPALVVSQSGVRFQASQGNVAPPAQTIQVTNPGSGSLNFTVTATTLSGNATWLAATPASGTSTSAAPASLNISADPTGLAPGNYYGLINISAPGAVNSPQLVEIVLNVLAACTGACVGGGPPALVTPTGLIFVAQPGASAPSQTVQVSNPSDSAVDLSTQITFQQSSGWLSVSPAPAELQANQTVTLTVSISTAGLTPGIYNGTLNVNILAAGVFNYPIEILLIVLPGTASQSRPHPNASAACTPTQLLPVFTLLGNDFSAPAAWPAPLQVDVVDDCGNPMTSGAVTTTFSSGDPAIALTSVGDGNWAGTWAPHNLNGAQVTVTVKAQMTLPALAGSAQISGSVSPNAGIPVVNTAGVVSAANFSNVPIAPGSFISIFGANLASGTKSSPSLPLETSLNGTAALLGSELLPLQFVSTGQINAVVPYDLPLNGTPQLLIQQNDAYSLPQPVAVAAAQPAMFTQNESGTGAGIIVVVKPDQTQFLATPATPAAAGDALVIYCAGLGAVSPTVPAGSAAPVTPLSKTIDPPTVTIGDQSAQVLFSGLAPGFAGLYQVNVLVPSGITPGTNVPVVLTMAGISSSPVTVPIQ